MSQSELARRLDMPQSYVSKIECGERSLRAGEIFSYAEGLGMTGAELLCQIGASTKGRPLR